MKNLEIKSTNYAYLLEGFTRWLELIGYAQTTASTLPVHVRELLHFLEQKKITHITQLKSRHVTEFIQHLHRRPNLLMGGSLSASSINKTIQSINTFARYLNQTGKHVLDITIRHMVNETDERSVLSIEEIKLLYEATFTPHVLNTQAIGQRDRAMIAIFYCCGLRKDEGTRLDVRDVDLIKRLVFVGKAKGNKQRYVPIAAKACEDIRAYLEEGRNWFLQDNHNSWRVRKRMKKQNTDDEAFFINHNGQRMKSFYRRFYYLKEKSEIEKDFSTHDLRHAIATHLLQAGMKIEDIAKFLGHSSLESTQIYTHIVQQLNTQKENDYEKLLLLSEK